MDQQSIGSVTQLLHAHRAGERAAFDRLVGLVYDDLRRIARLQLRKASPGITLDTGALIHDVYARLVDEASIDWQNRSHFYAVAARSMRFAVVDRARAQASQKRGGGLIPVELASHVAVSDEPAETVLAVNQAIEKLLAFNERLGRIVECRFFAGMTDGEIAAALDIGERTVQRDWMRAKAWLREVLAGPPVGAE